MDGSFKMLHAHHLFEDESLKKSDIIVAAAHCFLLEQGFKSIGTDEMVNMFYVSIHMVFLCLTLIMFEPVEPSNLQFKI